MFSPSPASIVKTHWMKEETKPAVEVEYEFYYEFTDATELRVVVVFWGRQRPFKEVIEAMEKYFGRTVSYKPLQGLHVPLMEFP